MTSKPDKQMIMPEGYLSAFLPDFFARSFEEYEVDDIYFALLAIQTLGLREKVFSSDADDLLAQKLYIQGMVAGALIAIDEIAHPVFVESRAITKIRVLIRESIKVALAKFSDKRQ